MNKCSLHAYGEMRQSHINLPLVPYSVIAKELQDLNNLSNEDRQSLANGVTEKHLVDLLSTICLRLVYGITSFLLRSLGRPGLTYTQHHFPGDDNNGVSYAASVPMNTQPLFDGCSYSTVTFKDVTSSLGHILDTSFGQFLGTVQRQSYDSNWLSVSLVEEIKELLGSELRCVSRSPFEESGTSVASVVIQQMVCYLMNILNDCFNAEDAPLSAESSQDNDTEIPGSRGNACPLPQVPKCSIDETFLTVCLAKLIDHIAVKTQTSVTNLDCHQIVTRVKERFVEDQSYTVPESVKNLHITIYNELCLKFASKYALQSMMEEGDEAFVEAFVEMLKAQLKKSTEKTSKSKKMWRIFRRNNKDNPVCNNKATEAHIEENEKENVRQQNRQCSGIQRVCSSIFSALRKAFTCSLTKQSETEESLC